jgi:TRAP-type transport system periplasmic protein
MRRVRTVTALVAVALLAATLLVYAGSAVAKDKVIKMRFNHTLPIDSNQDVYAKKFADMVLEKSGGRIKITVYPASQLGAGTQQMEATGMGAIDIGWGDYSQMEFIEPLCSLSVLPFFFQSFDDLEKIFDGEVGQILDASLIKKGNVRFLAHWWIGGRQMFTKVKLTGFAAAKGIKFRSPESNLYINTIKTVGMNPTPVAWPELYTALQSGLVDAGGCNYDNIVKQQFYKMCPFVWQSSHIVQIGGPIINEDRYQALSPELQKVMVDCAQAVAVEQRAAYIADEDKLIAFLKKEGVTVYPLQDFKDLDELSDRFQNGFWGDVVKKVNGEELFGKMKAAVGR